MKSGFNSHYVVTLQQGCPPPKPQEDNVYDEIVIPQEYVERGGTFLVLIDPRAQIVPVLLIRVDTRNFVQLEKKIAVDRVLPTGYKHDDTLVELSETLL